MGFGRTPANAVSNVLAEIPAASARARKAVRHSSNVAGSDATAAGVTTVRGGCSLALPEHPARAIPRLAMVARRRVLVLRVIRCSRWSLRFCAL